MIIINIFVRIVNSVLSLVGDIIRLLLLVFPDSPFNITIPADVSDILGKANYFIPISEMVVIAETWLVAIGIFYAYSIYARWSKTIQ